MNHSYNTSAFKHFFTSRLFACILGLTLWATVPTRAATWYVNDNDTIGDVYTTAVGAAGNPGTAAAPFLTIGAAITAAGSSDVIYVDAGTYSENITVGKSLHLRGPNYNISPNTGTRVSEAIILPASTNATSGAVVSITSGGVSINGFTMDGDNTSLPSSGTGLGGALGTSIDAARTIFVNANGINSVTIANNIAKNAVNGIRLEQTTNYFASGAVAVRSSNILVNDNLVQDMTGTGIRLGNSMYAKVTNNTVSNADNGIAFSSFRISDAGSAADRVIENNTISARYAGIWTNLFHASPYAIINNTITPAPAATSMAPTPQTRTAWFGIMYSTVSCPQNFTSQVNLPLVSSPEWWTANNNNIDGSALESTSVGHGYWLYYVDNNRDASGNDHYGQISGGTVSNVDIGFFLKNKDTDPATNFGTSAVGAHANVNGVSFSLRSGGVGFKLVDDATWTTANPAPLINKRTVALGIGSGVSISSGATGLSIIHPAAGTANYTAYSSITGGDLSDISFIGQSGDYVSLTNHPNGLTATSASFDGQTGATATLAQNYTIEVKISHKVDDATRGLVRVKASNIFVTSSNSVQLGIDAASANDIVNVQAGTYTATNVNKTVDLRGANYGIAGCGGRGSESNIVNASGTALTISTNGASVDGFQLTGITGLASSGYSATVSNNKVDAFAVGLNIASVSTGYTVAGNCVNLAGQLAGSTPTIGIALAGVAGTSPAILSNNTVSNPYYGYLLYAVNSSTTSAVTGGSITGVMQGVAVINVDPQTGTTYAPTTASLSGITMGGFTGAYPLLSAYDFHAGVYTFTGGSNTTATINLNVTGMDISGTGKHRQNNAGIYCGDFSTGSGNRQTVTINQCYIHDNKNRGITTSGANAVLNVTNSTLSGNGYDAYGTGGNDGYGLMAYNGSTINLSNSFVTLPATVSGSFPAYGMGAGLYSTSIINASNNRFDLNGLTNGALVNNGGGTVNATCNWWGSYSKTTVAALSAGSTTHSPWLVSDVDDDLVSIGFQPAGACIGGEALTLTESHVSVTCNGGNDGSIDLAVIGGLVPYSYSWSNGTTVISTDQDPSGLSQGTYVVTVTDDCGTTATTSITITEPSAITVNAGTDVQVCYPGYITLNGSVSTGTANWTGGTTASFSPDRNSLTAVYTPSAADSVAGSVTLTLVSDQCPSRTDEVILTVVPTLVSVPVSAPPVCVDGGNITIGGSINGLITSGFWTTDGDGSFTDQYDLNGEYNPALTDVGTVTLTLHSDSGTGCPSRSASVSLTVDDQATADAGLDLSICSGSLANLSGSITVATASTWSSTGTGIFGDENALITTYTPSAADITAGGVDITLTPDLTNACLPVTSTIHLTIYPPINGTVAVTSSYNGAQISCNGSSDGEITVTATGGTAPLIYSIDGGTYQSTNIFTGLAAGSHSLNVKDANNCVVSLSSVTITPPLALSVSMDPSDVSCPGGTDGSIDITVDGGTGTYSYSWSNSAITEDITGLTGGVYGVTVTDANSCSAFSSVPVGTKPDVTAPVIPVLTDVTGQCSATTTAPTTTDNCAGTVTGTTTDPLTYSTQGSFSITWTFDDGNGNTSTATQNVIVDDITAPAVPTLADVTGECSATATDPKTSDNCAGIVTGTTTDPLTYSTQGTFSITWTFDDGNGNTSTATQNIIVDDITAPAVPTLADVTGECSATSTAPTTTDNCAGTVTGTTTDPLTYSTQGSFAITWTFDDGNGNTSTTTQNVIVDDITAPAVPTLADVTGECSATATAPTTTDNCAGTVTGTTTDPLAYSTQGSFSITWTFDDGNGNTSTASQNVIVDDVTAPAVPTLADVTGECSATATAPTTTDNCAGTVTGTTTDPLTYSTQGSFSITWTFDDGNGNTSTATQNVIVDDVTAPTVPTLSAVTGQCSATATAPTTTDNCAGTVTGTTTDALTYSTQGTFTITWSFDDGNGNTSTASQNVIVDDITAPAVPTLADVTGECSATATAPTTTDNCSGTVTGTTTDPLTYSAQGTFLITWTFDDGNGNTSTASQNVIVDDITAPAVPTLADVSGECSATVTAPTTTDNCSGTVTGTTTDPLTYSTQGSFSITWTFDDGNGNTSTASQLVIVDDDTPPIASCQAATIYLDAAGSATLTTGDVDDNSTDNCVITGRSLSKTSFNCSNLGANTVTLTVTDIGGNSTTCASTVTVVDNIAPIISGMPASFTSSSACSGPVTWTPPTATDNCGTVTLTSTIAPGSVFPSGTTTVTYTATDGSGNSSTASFTVTVVSFSIGTTQTNVTCFGANDGTATVHTLNTQGAITYLWSNGATTQTATGLNAGTYTVTVTVGGTCSQSAFVIITSPARLNASTSSTDVSCYGGSNGNITFSNPTGGSGNYEFSITNGAFWQIPGTFSGLPAGSYTLLIRDASNRTCSRSLGSATIGQPNQLTVTIGTNPGTSVCQGGSITLCAVTSGPSSGATYLWSNLATTSCINYNTVGSTSYSVRVTNAAGCSATSPTVTVTVNPSVTAGVSISSNISGPVSPSTSITFTATPVNGGSSPTYTWKLNGSTVGTNSPTYTANAWTSGDAIQCIMASNAPCVSGSPATSNTITITVSSITVKYIVSDVTANRVYYYDPNFVFIQSNPLSTNVLNGVTNAEDIWATPNYVYILDGVNKRIYRSNGAATVTTVSRPLRNNAGQGLNPLTGIAIVGNHLLVVDKKAKAIYRYDLTAAFSGTTNYTALQKISLNTSNANAEALSYDAVTNAFYVLDNSSTKAFFRYPITSMTATTITIGSSTRSRPMLTNTGAALNTPTGSVVYGTDSIRITDRGLDRTFNYTLSGLYAGTLTVNLNAISVNNLNSGNLNSTGISLVSTTTLIRGVEDGTPTETAQEAVPEELIMYVYPNPAHDHFKVFISGLTETGDAQLHIFDMAGKMLYEEKIEAGSASFDKEFTLNNYAPGFYFVFITQGDQRKMMRLVIQ